MVQNQEGVNSHATGVGGGRPHWKNHLTFNREKRRGPCRKRLSGCSQAAVTGCGEQLGPGQRGERPAGACTAAWPRARTHTPNASSLRCRMKAPLESGGAWEPVSLRHGMGFTRLGRREPEKAQEMWEPEKPVLTRAAHRSRSLLAGRALCLKAEDPSKLKRLCVDPSPAPATINSAVCPAGAEFNKLRSEIL